MAQGVTFCAEAGLGGGLSSRSPVEALAFQQAQAGAGFPIRAQLMVAREVLGPVTTAPGDDVAQAFPLGLRTGLGSARLSLGALKIWLDGGMMARTAALTEPYVWDPEHRPADRRPGGDSPGGGGRPRGPAGSSPCTRSATRRSMRRWTSSPGLSGVRRGPAPGTGSSTPG